MGWETTKVETVKEIDKNPMVWLNAAVDAYEQKNWGDGLEKIRQAKEFANGNADLMMRCHIYEILLTYGSGDRDRARDIEQRSSINFYNYMLENMEIIYELWAYDSQYWEECLEDTIKDNMKVKSGRYSQINRIRNKIPIRILVANATIGYIKDLIEKDDTDFIKKLYAAGYDLKNFRYNRNNFLCCAINSAKLEISKWAISERINDINEQNSEGCMALHCAARLNSGEKYINLLLDNGASIDADGGGGTPLLVAIINKKGKNALCLIGRGADVNKPRYTESFMGNTPLMEAIRNGLFEVYICLIDNGANVNDCNSKGHTALMFAAEKDFDINDLLAHGANIHAENKEGIDALYCAAKNASTSCLEILLKNRANPNKHYRSLTNSRTLLMDIASGKHWEYPSRKIWEILLKYGAAVNEQDEKGYTALMLSLDHKWYISDELDLAQALLDKGAARQLKSKDGTTAKDICKKRDIALLGVPKRNPVDKFFNKFFK